MKLEIITPEKELYSGDIRLVKLPGTQGAFEILKDHAPIISTLETGNIKIINTEGEQKFFDIRGGIVEAHGNKVVVLVEKTESQNE